MKKLFKAIIKTVKWFFIAFLLFFISLFFRDQKLPAFLVDDLIERYSGGQYLISVGSVAVGFRHGVVVNDLRVFDREKKLSVSPIAEARRIVFNPMRRQIKVLGAKYPRLPDSYYENTVPHERNERLEFDIPRIPEYSIQLDQPEILGLKPSKVTVVMSTRHQKVLAPEVHVEWPGTGPRRTVDGSCIFDLSVQRFRAEVHGYATQAQMRDLFTTLEIDVMMPYYDAFTEIPEPIPASAEFDVDLTRGDFNIKIDLKPQLGRYRGVPMARAEGSIDITAGVRGTNLNSRVVIDVPVALDREGRRLGGMLAVDCTNDVVRLEYDVRSGLKKDDIVTIAQYIDPSILEMVKCETAPRISLKGTSGVSDADLDANALGGDVRLEKGSVFGLKVFDASAKYSLKRDRLSIDDIKVHGKAGGRYTAGVVLDLAGFNEERDRFSVDVKCEGGSLAELADFFDFDLGERRGRVDGSCHFSGEIATNLTDRLCGEGTVKITDGHLAQMKLFAGLTAMLADKVPGVGFLVNQSQASADFTVTNGVFKSDNVFIEGGFISIKGWGSYDIGKDDLDFTVRVQLLKEESFAGKLLHPLTWPFTKLLLEFRARGPLDNPSWHYISVLDRVSSGEDEEKKGAGK